MFPIKHPPHVDDTANMDCIYCRIHRQTLSEWDSGGLCAGDISKRVRLLSYMMEPVVLDFGHIRLRTYPDIGLCYLANAMLVTIFRFLYCTTVVEVWRRLVLSRTIHTALEYSR